MADKTYRAEFKLNLTSKREYAIYQAISKIPDGYTFRRDFIIDLLEAGLSSTGQQSLTESMKKEIRKVVAEEVACSLNPLLAAFTAGMKDKGYPYSEERVASEEPASLPNEKIGSVAEKWA